jgi:subtilisin family serine protease
MTPNLKTYQPCSYAYRDSDGNCSSTSTDGGTGGPSGKGKAKSAGPLRRNFVQTALKTPTMANQLVAEIDGAMTDAHAHGTGVAGAIASHARLTGSAPAARILAIRAFTATSGAAESNSYVILKALDHAVAHGAQIVNKSFAGPKDELIERAIAAVTAKGIV